MRTECGSPLPTCLAGLNPGERLPEDIGTICAAEVDMYVSILKLIHNLQLFELTFLKIDIIPFY